MKRFFLLIIFLSHVATTARSELVVESATLTNVVGGKDGMSFVLPYSERSRPIYLWTNIKGNLADLEQLKNLPTNEKPIRHIWYYLPFGGINRLPDNPDSLESESVYLKIGGPAFWKLLTAEAKSNHSEFDWRTWSFKKRFEAGFYVIQVQDHNGSVLNGKDGNEFSITFMVE